MKKPDKKLFVESMADTGFCDASIYTGIYTGSSFCENKLPSRVELAKFAGFARERGLSFHLVTPFLSETGFARAVSLAKALAKSAPGSEIIVNDLGMLATIASEFPALVPVAGRLLASQKTDPRIPEIIKKATGSQAREKKRLTYSQLSANKTISVDFFRSFRVDRIELQNSIQGFHLIDKSFKYSLHVPYVYVSTTRFCPPVDSFLKDGRAPGFYPCNHDCDNSYFRLATGDSKELLLKRGNTVYYVNRSLSSIDGIDRIVTHLRPS